MILALLAVFAPVQQIIIATFVLVLADLVVGVTAAKKRGEAIRSGKLKRTVGKLAVYETAVCIGFIGEQYMLGGAVHVTKIIAGLVGVVELISVLENLNSIYGSPLFRAVIDRLAPANAAKGKE